MNCQGDGACLIQCYCDCFNECECECNSNSNCTKEFDNNGVELGCDGRCCNCKHIDNCEWANGIHKDCGNWCLVPSNCQYNCKLYECPNYEICKNKETKWYLNCHNGCCLDCDIINYPRNKKLIFLEEISECCICFEEKK